MLGRSGMQERLPSCQQVPRASVFGLNLLIYCASVVGQPRNILTSQPVRRVSWSGDCMGPKGAQPSWR